MNIENDAEVEIAFFSEALSHILELLKGLHGTAVNAIHTSRGEINPNVGEALKYLKQDHEYKKSQHEQKNQEHQPNPLQPYNKDADAPNFFQQKISNVKGPSINAIQKAHNKTYRQMQKQIKHLIGKVQKVQKQNVKTPQQKRPNNPSSKYPSTPTAKPKIQEQQFIAKKTVQIKVSINGKIATTTIKKGSPFSILKTSGGMQLKRRGQRGVVFVAPSQLSKIK